MASMKSRIIAHILTIIATYNDLAGCEKQIARLRELGAPASLLASEAERQVAMREELPRMVAFIEATFASRDSLTTIQRRTAAEGYSAEALYAITPD